MVKAKSHKVKKAPVGRPREHDRDQIASDLIEWARKEDSINLNKFCCTREPPLAPSKISIWASECPLFRKAYETAKAFLGARREEWLNQEVLHVKAYDLNATTYDYFLKEEKRDQSAFESKLKGKEEEVVGEQAINQFNAFMNQLEAIQSARKIDDIKSIKEQKS